MRDFLWFSENKLRNKRDNLKKITLFTGIKNSKGHDNDRVINHSSGRRTDGFGLRRTSLKETSETIIHFISTVMDIEKENVSFCQFYKHDKKLYLC